MIIKCSPIIASTMAAEGLSPAIIVGSMVSDKRGALTVIDLGGTAWQLLINDITLPEGTPVQRLQ